MRKQATSWVLANCKFAANPLLPMDAKRVMLKNREKELLQRRLMMEKGRSLKQPNQPIKPLPGNVRPPFSPTPPNDLRLQKQLVDNKVNEIANERRELAKQKQMGDMSAPQLMNEQKGLAAEQNKFNIERREYDEQRKENNKAEMAEDPESEQLDEAV